MYKRQGHPQIAIADAPHYYDIEVFNYCEENDYILLTLDGWNDIHPSLVTIPFEVPYSIPYGIVYSTEPNKGTKRFLEIVSSISVSYTHLPAFRRCSRTNAKPMLRMLQNMALYRDACGLHFFRAFFHIPPRYNLSLIHIYSRAGEILRLRFRHQLRHAVVRLFNGGIEFL